MSAELFVAMLKQIMRARAKPLFLVLDSLPAHKAKAVRAYVETTDGDGWRPGAAFPTRLCA